MNLRGILCGLRDATKGLRSILTRSRGFRVYQVISGVLQLGLRVVSWGFRGVSGSGREVPRGPKGRSKGLSEFQGYFRWYQ